MTCQWTNLVGSYENCSNTIYSPGLWGKFYVDEEGITEPCTGTGLIANVSSEYYVVEEFNQQLETEYIIYIYSDQNLLGIVYEISASVPIPGEGYQNSYVFFGQEGGATSFGFSSADEYRDTPYLFSISAIQFSDGPKRTFDSLDCFVLGSSQCV